MTGAIYTKFGRAPTTCTMVALSSKTCGAPGMRTRFGGCVTLISGGEPTQRPRAHEEHPHPSARCHYAPGQPGAKVFTAGPAGIGRLLPTQRPGISPTAPGAREGNHPQ